MTNGPSKSSRQVWVARAVAVTADLVQIAIFPAFLGGLLSPVNAILDVVVAVVLTLLVGWHIAFLPTFLIEQLPFVDLAPTWTIAVLVATRRKRSTSSLSAEPVQ